jgi:pimeloyl-ACP methyl ester carboxylesterase
MAGYVMIGGQNTWVDDARRSDGEQPVLLLHGGLSNSDLLGDALASTIGDAGFGIVSFDRRGHGRTGDTDAPFHYADMAEETIAVLEQVVGGPAHLVGFSDGGNVALLVTLGRPDLVRSMVCISANYSPEGIDLDIDPEDPVIGMIADAYGAASPDGPDHFPAVLEKTLAMFNSEPTLTTADLAGVTRRSLVVAGDDDAVELSHTCSLFEAISPELAQLAVIPGTSHLVPIEKPELLGRVIVDFLTTDDPPATLMPHRRGATPTD